MILSDRWYFRRIVAMATTLLLVLVLRWLPVGATPVHAQAGATIEETTDWLVSRPHRSETLEWYNDGIRDSDDIETWFSGRGCDLNFVFKDLDRPRASETYRGFLRRVRKISLVESWRREFAFISLGEGIGFSIWRGSIDEGERITKAIIHGATLCGSLTKEPF